MDFFKVKENVISIKERLLNHFYKLLNASNDYNFKPVKSPRYYIGCGNNHELVRSQFRSRLWWCQTDSMNNANLVWTQWKVSRITKSLPTVYGIPFDLDPISKTGFCEEVNSKSNIEKSFTSFKQITKSDENESIIKICNHLEGNTQLGNKKAMFHNMKRYYESLGKDPFKVMPMTFHIKNGKEDEEYEEFVKSFHIFEKTTCQNVWIIKPGENSNRGMGISLAKDLAVINECITKSKQHTYILQKYIERPLLFNKRKFDIRCYGLLTAVNAHIKGYFYKEGYIRTASKDFSLKNINSKIVHLTNEAIQKKYDDFGKFESGNKLTFMELQRYLDTAYSEKKVNLYRDIIPEIKNIVSDSFKATHGKLDPKGRKYTFEIFGYDFMIDTNFQVYLIEININPCLEIMSPITGKIVPAMVDNSLRIALDPLFQPYDTFPFNKRVAGDIFPEIKHELVYDSDTYKSELESKILDE